MNWYRLIAVVFTALYVIVFALTVAGPIENLAVAIHYAFALDPIGCSVALLMLLSTPALNRLNKRTRR